MENDWKVKEDDGTMMITHQILRFFSEFSEKLRPWLGKPGDLSHCIS